MDLFVGTSGYSYKEWKGSFYPAKLPANQMLSYYGERFRTVEANNTFFAMPKPETLEQWSAQVGDGFRFAIKAPKQITHVQSLKDKGESVSRLCEVVVTLDSHLGPVLFQLPPTFKKDLPRLKSFLGLLPSKVRSAFEFRHPSWFDDEVFGLMRDHKVALCVADETDELKVPFEATTTWGYLRLRRTDYDDAAIKEWVKRIKGAGWSDAFVYFRHEDEGNGPRLAQRMLDLAK